MVKEVCLGIDMGGTQIKLGLVDTEEKLLMTEMLSARSDLSMRVRMEQLVIDINRILCDKFRLVGVGLAFPGIVDYNKKKIVSKYVKYVDAHKMDFIKWGQKHWGVPVIVENDARAALFGEWQYGSGKGSNNLLMVTLGTGMGSAVLIEGKLLRGRNFMAGNLGGHMSIDFEGDKCNCGNIGCVETIGSTWALSNNFMRLKNYKKSSMYAISNISYKDVFLHASKGDEIARKLKIRSLEAWSSGIINLLHAYDPEKLIIGGGVMKSESEIIPFIEKRVSERSWLPRDGIIITSAKNTNYSGILGVCYLLKK